MGGDDIKTDKTPTTTKLLNRVKKDDDRHEFVRSRLVAHDFKPTSEGPRDDLFGSNAAVGSKEGVVRICY